MKLDELYLLTVWTAKSTGTQTGGKKGGDGGDGDGDAGGGGNGGPGTPYP